MTNTGDGRLMVPDAGFRLGNHDLLRDVHTGFCEDIKS